MRSTISLILLSFCNVKTQVAPFWEARPDIRGPERIAESMRRQSYSEMICALDSNLTEYNLESAKNESKIMCL